MKIVVIGGSGLIGSKLVTKLREHGYEAVAASPNTGVDTLTGKGLTEVLKDASVVADVSNSPNWEDGAVMKFFETSTRNLLNYEAAAGVGHHVALSVVGTDRLLESGYFRAKLVQENLIKEAAIPYSIVRATQFFEFIRGIADLSTVGNEIRLPHVFIQPMAADDVATALGRVVIGAPVNGTVEVGGPERFRLDELVRKGLAAHNDSRQVIGDPEARYYGVKVTDNTLVPDPGARLGESHFAKWLSEFAPQIPAAKRQPTLETGAMKV
ncbi:MAG TPA: SDR family oxidoreductase [Bryobacteraceae bacterium]|nr:SDR family oxidoreductase [Bryobacteraceae bacterium]